MNLEKVNVKIGTDNDRRMSNGNILPLLSVPNGMASFTVQTNLNNGTFFYSSKDTSFECFRLTHQPSPWVGDYGEIGFLPQTEADNNTEYDRYWTSFTDEIFTPYYYSVFLNRYKVRLESTPTNSGCKFIFSYKDIKVNILTLFFYTNKYNIKLVDDNTISGYTDKKNQFDMGRVREYFILKTNQKIEKLVNDGENSKVYFNSKNISVDFVTSFISEKQAEINLNRELNEKTFEEIKENAKSLWNDKFDKIEVSHENNEREKIFYSSIYRMYLFPRKFYEIDECGEEIHITENGEIKKGKMYTDNGFWDTYRTVYPFLAIVDKKLYADMIEGFINYAEDTGYLPKWLSPYEIGIMPGTLIEAVIADAVIKNIITKQLAVKAYKYMLKDAFVPSNNNKQGRKGCKEYNQYGYVPKDEISESVNNTLDSCYGDYCIYVVAKYLGDKENEKIFYERSKNYKNLFDKETGFMRGKYKDGSIDKTFSPYSWGGDYCEGSAWQSSFAVCHDILGLAKLYGGNDKFEEKLDELFSSEPIFEVGGYKFEIHEMSELARQKNLGQCAISNQPSFHLPYLYSYINKKEKTTYYVEKIISEAFTSQNDGYPGDEDNGTMAGWFVFSVLGFYPVCPGKNEYAISKKLFKSIKILCKEIKETNKNVASLEELI